MTLILRLLSFVPPTLLFVIPAFTQLQGKLELLPDNSYRVSVISNVDWEPPQSLTNSAQITLRAPSGKLNVSGFQSLTGIWSPSSPIQSPSEAPGFDYFSFSLSSPIINLSYQTGAAVPLFSFQNNGGCTFLEIIDNQADPFLPPNSLSVNVGNFFSVLGAGIGLNAYQGNSSEYFLNCPPLLADAIALNNPVPCHGDVTDITVSVAGGAEPYAVSWENQTTGEAGITQITTYGGTVTLENMAPGSYLFSLTDAIDSVFTINVMVTEPAPIEVEVAAFDASCNGSLDGVAFVDDVSGGTVTGDYQYFWETSPDISSPNVGFLNPGSYTVTVVDDNGCTAESAVEVGSFAVIYPNPQVRQITCFHSGNGVIDLYPVGANPPFTYQWTPNVTTGEYSSAWQLGPGFYSVTLTDATGICSEIVDFTLEEPPAIEADYRISEPRCFGDKGSISVLSVENNQGEWEAAIAGETDFSSHTEFELEPGFAYQLIIQDEQGCTATEDFIIPSRQELILDLGEDRLIKFGEQITFDSDIFPLENITFQWTPQVGLSCADCPDPVASPEKNTTYQLKMTDTAGCTAVDRVVVWVKKSRDIYIPNAFSPNSDGVNDVFCPYSGFEVTSIKSMRIFDRWGGLVHEIKESFVPGDDIKTGWNGLINGKPADSGVYLYSMNVEFIDGEVVLFAGEVHLMR